MIDYDFGVKLCRIAREDLPKLLSWRNDYRVWRHCRQNDLLHETHHEKWFEKQASDPTISMYAVTSNAKIVGVCGLTDIDLINRRAEFSLYIGPEYQSHGYGESALKTLFAHGFNRLGLNTIWGETYEHNSAARLFARIGMKQDGIRRQFYWRDGKFIDAILFSITAEECKWKNSN